MALQWAKENSDVGHSGSGSFGLWWTGCILVRLQMVAVITDLLNFFFYKGLQNLDKPISNNADPPSWCIPFENCPERGFSGSRFYSNNLDLPSHSHGQLAVGDNEKNKTIVIFVLIFIPKWQTSRANWWQRSGGYLASQNCRLCSVRSMVILVGGLTQAIGCGYRLANNLLRSRVGGVREVGYSRCLDCGELGRKAWWKEEKRRGVG